MKKRTIHYLLALTLFSASLLSSCRKLDNPNLLRDAALKQNLWEMLSANPEYAAFLKLAREAGMDSLLNSSKVYTVFVPVNAAVQLMDPALTATPALKRRFVANHIAPSMFNVTNATGTVRLEMLNGKFNEVTSTGMESMPFKSTNSYASNGIVHVLNGVVRSLDNCWEYLIGNNSPTRQRVFLNSLWGNTFDLTNAVLIGVDPNTGANLYQRGTDSVFANAYLRRVYDLRDERKQFTMFVPEDAAWDAELAAYRPFFTASTTDSTNFATAWNVYRDLVIDSLIQPQQLRDTVVTRFGAKIPINRANIASAIKMSNGIVYVMRSLNVPPVAKFQPRIIQAEQFVAASVDRRSQTFFRERFNTLTGRRYNDVLVLNHGVALFNLRYDVEEIPNIRYRATWVSVNDFQTATFQQRLGVGSPLSALLPYVNVNANVQAEVLLGEFAIGRYMPVLNLFLTAANSTANAANPLVCDYIRLEPRF